MAPRVVNGKTERGDVYIGRPSKWGNPFSWLPGTPVKYKVQDRLEAIDAYEQWVLSQPELILEIKKELKTKVLECHCWTLPCHGDVLLKIANES